MSRPVQVRCANVLLLTMMLAGCGGWKQQPVAPATLIDQNHPRYVRVTRLDRSHVILHRPLVEGDSLRGLIDRKKPLAVPLNDIAFLSTKRSNAGGWIVLTAVVVVAGVMAGVSSTLNGLGP